MRFSTPGPLQRCSRSLVLPARSPAQGTGRIIGRVVDAEQGAAGGRGPGRGGRHRDPRRVGRWTAGTRSTDVPAGPVSVRVRMIGFAPKTVTGRRGADGADGRAGRGAGGRGGAAGGDLGERGVGAGNGEPSAGGAAQRGEHRQLGERRADRQEPRQRRRPGDPAGERGDRRRTASTSSSAAWASGIPPPRSTAPGSRAPSRSASVVPLDLFPASLLEGITTSKTFTPEQPGDFSGAQVDLKTREFPASRSSTSRCRPASTRAATGKDLVKAPTTGTEWLGFAGSERHLPTSVEDAGDLRGITRPERTT